MKFSIPNSWRKVFGLSATFLIALFLIVSCKKKESNLGANALDPDDLLNSEQIDTFALTTFTIEEDSVITSNPSFALLGSYNDPKFGTFDANFYTQLRLSGLSPNFGDVGTIWIDSLVLGLEYVSSYGDFSDQILEVYELTESLDMDSTYYASDVLTHSATNLVEPGFETFTPNPSGITVIGSDTVETQLRIRLKNSLAQQLIDEAALGGSNFSSNENFVEYFKGLHVKVNNGAQSPGTGGVFYFNLNDPSSKMTIYYEQDGIDKQFDFLINAECADFNHVDIVNTGHVQEVIDDTISGQSQFYAQAFKSRAVVSIPGMANIPSKSIIHKAQLILPIQYQTGAKYEPSYDLFVSIETENGLSGIGVVAIYDSYNKQYTVDLKNYMQALTSGQISATELILSPRFFISSAERVVFNGPTTINKKKPQLVITYTEY